MKRGPAAVTNASTRESTTSGSPGSSATHSASSAGVPRNAQSRAGVAVEGAARHARGQLDQPPPAVAQRVPLRTR